MSEVIDFLISFEPGDWFGLTLRGIFVYLFVLWVALVIWVARDIVSRTDKLILQVIAIILVIALNIFGLLVYLIVRPQKTLLERYQEDVEHKVLTENEEVCPSCEHSLPLQFQFCPACGMEARQSCKKCKKLVSKGWAVCPYCGEKKKISGASSEPKQKTRGTLKKFFKRK